jgi:hypothetical protein
VALCRLGEIRLVPEDGQLQIELAGILTLRAGTKKPATAGCK